MKTIRNIIVVVILLTALALSKTNTYNIVSNDGNNIVVLRKGRYIQLYYPNYKGQKIIKFYSDYDWNWSLQSQRYNYLNK